MTASLPILAHLHAVRQALEIRKRAVILAPPGAGKTTRVPLALLSESWLAGQKILLLEPRRLAAVTCAAHMASLLGEKTGETVGYRIRLDRKIGPKTRIEVVTEGIFTRTIQADPELQGFGLVIFDEFHERNLHTDLGLALCLETAGALREDLRILVMSATMDADRVSGLLDQAPVVVSEGRRFPVQTVYCPPVDKLNRPLPVLAACEAVIGRALTETRGDMLVFLPGVGEIRTLMARLGPHPDSGLDILPLYGDLSVREQARIFHPRDPARRRIVLSTAIAETSVTIDGIQVVIDAGLMRVPRFSPATGMTRLETLPVSRASADQRRGRAGRTGPGVCYRLWSEYDHGVLKPFTSPEIQKTDLCGPALELAAWGVTDPSDLKWLDPPDPAAFAQAVGLLQSLAALDSEGRITPHGKQMVSAGLHPRLAHMVIQGIADGDGRLACRLAALLEERDILTTDRGERDPDIGLRLMMLEEQAKKKQARGRGLIDRILAAENKLIRDFRVEPALGSSNPVRPARAGLLLARAFPDRIARRRAGKDPVYLMASGKGAYFSFPYGVSAHEWIVAVHLDGNPRNARIHLAAPLLREDLEQAFGDCFIHDIRLFLERPGLTVQARARTLFGAIVVEERPVAVDDPEAACGLLLDEIRKKGLFLLPWNKKLDLFRDRVGFLRLSGRFPDLPDVSDAALMANLEVWLKPFMINILCLTALDAGAMETALFSLFSWKDRNLVEIHAPTHMTVPSGSRLPLVYRNAQGLLDSPVLQVRLQEMFGAAQTPEVGGRAVTLHLLSPAGRPVQITRDLAGFWKNTYPEVKKDLMGRYPKHYWPEDPLTAEPTSRAQKRLPAS